MNKKRRLSITLILFFAAFSGAHAQNLIPKPVETIPGEGNFVLTPATTILCPDDPELAEYLNDHLVRVCGFPLPITRHGTHRIPRHISLRKHESLPEEGYRIDISPQRIEIEGGGRGGLFYALQTLFQLMPPEVFSDRAAGSEHPVALPCLRIEDAPRFPYRGVMLDVSRNFSDKQTVMRYLDWMSRHKLNRFHWHLTDDDGWRIEIKKYPELTARGAWRGPGEALPPSYGSGQKRYGGFYTQDDVREIVRYAQFRNIEIIPEIDLPGHSHAAARVRPEIFCLSSLCENEPSEAMHNVWCAGREENFEILRDIFQELAALFPSEYIHIGGDEVSLSYWKTCSRCKALMQRKQMKKPQELFGYFVRRLEETVHSVGKKCGAWNEAAESGTLKPSTLIYGWKDVRACEEAARKGQPVVMMPASYCYIDMKQSPSDRGHTWAWMVDARRTYSFDPSQAELTPEQMKRIEGVEAAQWAELLDRPERFIEYQGYPRLCALAEVGWSPREARNWNDFYERLTESHLDRLTQMGIGFRMFPPEVGYAGGTITASSPVTGATIRYTDDLSEPTAASKEYTAPITAPYPERYRFKTFYGTGSSSPVAPSAYHRTLTLRPGSRQTMTVPLSEHTDKDGIWYLSVIPEDDRIWIDRLEITGPDTVYTIIRNGQKANPFANLRIYADAGNRTADLNITLSNRSDERESVVDLHLRPSPYIEPEVSVSGSLPLKSRFPARNLSDYNFLTYSRSDRPCKKGDYLLYTFDTPLTCRSIEVNTGIPGLTRYIVTQGRVAYSTDGKTFIPVGSLDDCGSLTFTPQAPVRVVRICIDGSNGEPIVSFQDLKILPKSDLP